MPCLKWCSTASTRQRSIAQCGQASTLRAVRVFARSGRGITVASSARITFTCARSWQTRMPSEAIRLTLRSAIAQPVEIDGLTPDRTAMLSAAEIAVLPVSIGSRRAALGDFFAVDGERSDRLHIDGDLRNVDGLGAATASGELLVHGSVGGRVGAGMTGGWIDIRGGAGDEAGLGMSGG